MMTSVLFFLALLFSPLSTQAQVYTWVGEDGLTHYSDIPKEKEATLVILPPSPYQKNSTSSPLYPSKENLSLSKEKNAPNSAPSSQNLPPDIQAYCDQALTNLNILQAFQSRVHYVTANGEYHYLDDKERQTTILQTEQQLKQFCQSPKP